MVSFIDAPPDDSKVNSDSLFFMPADVWRSGLRVCAPSEDPLDLNYSLLLFDYQCYEVPVLYWRVFVYPALHFNSTTFILQW